MKLTFRFRHLMACFGALTALLTGACTTTSPPDKPGGRTAEVVQPRGSEVEAVRAQLSSTADASTQTTISIPRGTKQVELELPKAAAVPPGTTAEIARADGSQKSQVTVETAPGKPSRVTFDPKIFDWGQVAKSTSGSVAEQYNLSIKSATKTDTYPIRIERQIE